MFVMNSVFFVHYDIDVLIENKGMNMAVLREKLTEANRRFVVSAALKFYFVNVMSSYSHFISQISCYCFHHRMLGHILLKIFLRFCAQARIMFWLKHLRLVP